MWLVYCKWYNKKYIDCQYHVQTWSFTTREERRLRLFEKRVLRRILGPKRDKLKGEWRKLHNKELNEMH
jgi:hypothetical protein